jgi:hypothetical protein
MFGIMCSAITYSWSGGLQVSCQIGNVGDRLEIIIEFFFGPEDERGAEVNWVAQTSFVSITTSAIPVVETVYFTFNICGFGGAAQTHTYTHARSEPTHTQKVHWLASHKDCRLKTI